VNCQAALTAVKRDQELIQSEVDDNEFCEILISFGLFEKIRDSVDAV